MDFEILQLIACGQLSEKQSNLLKDKWSSYSESFNILAEKLEQSQSGIEVSELQKVLDANSELIKLMYKIG